MSTNARFLIRRASHRRVAPLSVPIEVAFAGSERRNSARAKWTGYGLASAFVLSSIAWAIIATLVF